MLYLDNNASTPLDPRVNQALCSAFAELYGNPSNSHHRFGKLAYEALENSRAKIRKLLNADGFQVIFTSSATEALNLAIIGLRPSRVIVGSTEHPAVLETCRWLEHQSRTRVTPFAVDKDGTAVIPDIEEKLYDATSLLIAMLANNETGVVHPVKDIARFAAVHRVPILCDATQAIGKIRVSLDELDVDMIALSGHKIYGPRGVGVLLYREETLSGQLQPIIHGGAQEYGLRSGTENVPAIVALAEALEICVAQQPFEAKHMASMRERFESRLCESTQGIIVNGSKATRLPNTSSISIDDVNIDIVLGSLESVAVSTASACSSQKRAGSHVLRAMGIPDTLNNSTLRISFGRFSRIEQADLAADIISDAIRRARSLR